MQKKEPKVAVLMATYNGEKYLGEQLDSILNQSYKNITLFISDDYSKDNTVKIIQKYIKKYKNQIVFVNNTNNSGAKMNFANVFNIANNFDYYLFCDQDDVWDTKKVETLVNEALKYDNDKELIVYNDLVITDANLGIMNNSLIQAEKKKLPNKNLFGHILIENYFPGCAMLFNDKLKRRVDTIYSGCEMHDWWVTLVGAYFGNIVFVDKSLQYYRQHGNNTIGAIKKSNIITKLRKLKEFNKTKQVWKNYQEVVLRQAMELYQKYGDSEKNSENYIVLQKFLRIMQLKNPFKKFFFLLKYDFIPRNKIRIFRLIIQ